MSTASRASVIREQRTGLEESSSFLDSSLSFIFPRTVSSIGVGRGEGRGRSVSTGGREREREGGGAHLK